MTLSGYHYNIQFRPTAAHGNADCLSRIPLSLSSSAGNYEDPAVFNIGQIESLPVQVSQVMAATRSDPVLSRVLQYARTGWPSEVNGELQQFWRKREEIVIEGDCYVGDACHCAREISQLSP